MSLDGAQLMHVNAAGVSEAHPAKGRKFIIGSYVDSDLELADADRLHCEIQCDSFGRVTIRNNSLTKPILLDGQLVNTKRPLLHGAQITILNEVYTWDFPKVSECEHVMDSEPRTPERQPDRVAEQAPNSCPGRATNRALVANRMTVHNFRYSINSDDEGNTSIESRNESDALLDISTSKDEERCDTLPTPQIADDTPKIDLLEATQNKENTSTPSNKIILQLCARSDMVITSFSPRETGIKIEKSFTRICKPNSPNVAALTPKSVYSTPKSVLSELNEESCSRDLMDFSTPSTSKKALAAKPKASMYLIDLTTPKRLAPVLKTPSTPASGSSLSESTPIVVVDSSVESAKTSSIISITDSAGPDKHAVVTPKRQLQTAASTPKRTPQSLMKRALLTSAKKLTTQATPGTVTPKNLAAKHALINSRRQSLSTPIRRLPFHPDRNSSIKKTLPRKSLAAAKPRDNKVSQLRKSMAAVHRTSPHHVSNKLVAKARKSLNSPGRSSPSNFLSQQPAKQTPSNYALDTKPVSFCEDKMSTPDAETSAELSRTFIIDDEDECAVLDNGGSKEAEPKPVVAILADEDEENSTKELLNRMEQLLAQKTSKEKSQGDDQKQDTELKQHNSESLKIDECAKPSAFIDMEILEKEIEAEDVATEADLFENLIEDTANANNSTIEASGIEAETAVLENKEAASLDDRNLNETIELSNAEVSTTTTTTTAEVQPEDAVQSEELSTTFDLAAKPSEEQDITKKNELIEATEATEDISDAPQISASEETKKISSEINDSKNVVDITTTDNILEIDVIATEPEQPENSTYQKDVTTPTAASNKEETLCEELLSSVEDTPKTNIVVDSEDTELDEMHEQLTEKLNRRSMRRASVEASSKPTEGSAVEPKTPRRQSKRGMQLDESVGDLGIIVEKPGQTEALESIESSEENEHNDNAIPADENYGKVLTANNSVILKESEVAKNNEENEVIEDSFCEEVHSNEQHTNTANSTKDQTVRELSSKFNDNPTPRRSTRRFSATLTPRRSTRRASVDVVVGALNSNKPTRRASCSACDLPTTPKRNRRLSDDVQATPTRYSKRLLSTPKRGAQLDEAIDNMGAIVEEREPTEAAEKEIEAKETAHEEQNDLEAPAVDEDYGEEIHSSDEPDKIDYKGMREMLKTPKSCSTPRFKGLREMMRTPKVNASPILGNIEELLEMSDDVGGTPKSATVARVSLQECRKSLIVDEECDKFFKTPRAKNIMIPNEPGSALLQSHTNASVPATEYDLNSTNASMQLEKIFDESSTMLTTNVTETELSVAAFNTAAGEDPLSVSKLNTNAEPEADQTNADRNESISSEALMSINCAASTSLKDPLTSTAYKAVDGANLAREIKLSNSGSESANDVNDMSGIQMLDQTTDSIFSEPLMVSGADSENMTVEETKMTSTARLTYTLQEEKENTLEYSQHESTLGLGEPLVVSDDEEEEEEQKPAAIEKETGTSDKGNSSSIIELNRTPETITESTVDLTEEPIMTKETSSNKSAVSQIEVENQPTTSTATIENVELQQLAKKEDGTNNNDTSIIEIDQTAKNVNEQKNGNIEEVNDDEPLKEASEPNSNESVLFEGEKEETMQPQSNECIQIEEPAGSEIQSNNHSVIKLDEAKDQNINEDESIIELDEEDADGDVHKVEANELLETASTTHENTAVELEEEQESSVGVSINDQSSLQTSSIERISTATNEETSAIISASDDDIINNPESSKPKLSEEETVPVADSNEKQSIVFDLQEQSLEVSLQTSSIERISTATNEETSAIISASDNDITNNPETSKPKLGGEETTPVAGSNGNQSTIADLPDQSLEVSLQTSSTEGLPTGTNEETSSVISASDDDIINNPESKPKLGGEETAPAADPNGNQSTIFDLPDQSLEVSSIERKSAMTNEESSELRSIVENESVNDPAPIGQEHIGSTETEIREPTSLVQEEMEHKEFISENVGGCEETVPNASQSSYGQQSLEVSSIGRKSAMTNEENEDENMDNPASSKTTSVEQEEAEPKEITSVDENKMKHNKITVGSDEAVPVANQSVSYGLQEQSLEISSIEGKSATTNEKASVEIDNAMASNSLVFDLQEQSEVSSIEGISVTTNDETAVSKSISEDDILDISEPAEQVEPEANEFTSVENVENKIVETELENNEEPKPTENTKDLTDAIPDKDHSVYGTEEKESIEISSNVSDRSQEQADLPQEVEKSDLLNIAVGEETQELSTTASSSIIDLDDDDAHTNTTLASEERKTETIDVSIIAEKVVGTHEVIELKAEEIPKPAEHSTAEESKSKDKDERAEIDVEGQAVAKEGLNESKANAQEISVNESIDLTNDDLSDDEEPTGSQEESSDAIGAESSSSAVQKATYPTIAEQSIRLEYSPERGELSSEDPKAENTNDPNEASIDLTSDDELIEENIQANDKKVTEFVELSDDSEETPEIIEKRTEAEENVNLSVADGIELKLKETSLKTDDIPVEENAEKIVNVVENEITETEEEIVDTSKKDTNKLNKDFRDKAAKELDKPEKGPIHNITSDTAIEAETSLHKKEDESDSTTELKEATNHTENDNSTVMEEAGVKSISVRDEPKNNDNGLFEKTNKAGSSDEVEAHSITTNVPVNKLNKTVVSDHEEEQILPVPNEAQNQSIVIEEKLTTTTSTEQHMTEAPKEEDDDVLLIEAESSEEEKQTPAKTTDTQEATKRSHRTEDSTKLDEEIPPVKRARGDEENVDNTAVESIRRFGRRAFVNKVPVAPLEITKESATDITKVTSDSTETKQAIKTSDASEEKKQSAQKLNENKEENIEHVEEMPATSTPLRRRGRTPSTKVDQVAEQPKPANRVLRKGSAAIEREAHEAEEPKRRGRKASSEVLESTATENKAGELDIEKRTRRARGASAEVAEVADLLGEKKKINVVQVPAIVFEEPEAEVEANAVDEKPKRRGRKASTEVVDSTSKKEIVQLPSKNKELGDSKGNTDRLTTAPEAPDIEEPIVEKPKRRGRKPSAEVVEAVDLPLTKKKEEVESKGQSHRTIILEDPETESQPVAEKSKRRGRKASAEVVEATDVPLTKKKEDVESEGQSGDRPKRRGRKASADVVETSIVNIPLKKVEDYSKEALSQIDEVFETKEQPKRRGRNPSAEEAVGAVLPKDQQITQHLTVPTELGEKTVTRRGRKATVDVELTEENKTNEVAEKPKRRGRRPSTDVVPTETKMEDPVDAAVPKPTRRGRKDAAVKEPQHKKEEETQTPASPPEKSKRRARKASASVEPDDEAVPPKKVARRGRKASAVVEEPDVVEIHTPEVITIPPPAVEQAKDVGSSDAPLSSPANTEDESSPRRREGRNVPRKNYDETSDDEKKTASARKPRKPTAKATATIKQTELAVIPTPQPTTPKAATPEPSESAKPPEQTASQKREGRNIPRRNYNETNSDDEKPSTTRGRRIRQPTVKALELIVNSPRPGTPKRRKGKAAAEDTEEPPEKKALQVEDEPLEKNVLQGEENESAPAGKARGARRKPAEVAETSGRGRKAAKETTDVSGELDAASVPTTSSKRNARSRKESASSQADELAPMEEKAPTKRTARGKASSEAPDKEPPSKRARGKTQPTNVDTDDEQPEVVAASKKRAPPRGKGRKAEQEEEAEATPTASVPTRTARGRKVHFEAAEEAAKLSTLPPSVGDAPKRVTRSRRK
ncbi:titin [Scaptodrosophila lebanonensis]|uniref:Titin n=1 Tax=Drosophila lebanonensis TaxID=7225 RepID=A0A6J2TDJ5_DROLE|nr:titin [Scaptodrosophila lebanonensis]